MVNGVQSLKAKILTGKELNTKSKQIDVQIVVCGDFVKEIIKEKVLQDLVVDAVKKTRLKILVCGLSVEQSRIDKTLLPIQIPVTTNGLFYIFGLQELGYKTIAL
ncbi:hypothetical protein [Pedobacter sp. MC2016-24]|uniref:hypothetical protein n=1 Tax=Pedobacter sp. MC2016-24 TaxID=2780090 RepID=UPI001881988E|nr:hypothetical protein [Pedobacter sp. MC2016-24]MBE9601554.1 hypothetical protein [Pedobacter sp. MC2016-24]